MKKSIPIIVMAALCLFFNANAQQQATILNGKVTDQKGIPIPGSTIRIKDEKVTAQTNTKGEFNIVSTKQTGILQISYLGYNSIVIPFNPAKKTFNIILTEDQSELKEVEIVSTGYQTLPKERSTGSFVLIDSTLINRSLGTNILSRLDGVASGLIFNRNNAVGGVKSDLSIRGRSTLFGNPDPLIVLDNFPYEGDLNNINPNDIESITILKDAAAASIWGTKAGNGVIVITTKKGSRTGKSNISFNNSITIGQKPRLFTQTQLTSKEYIEVEQYLFDKGKYNSTINNGYGSLSPAVEIMLLHRQGNIRIDKRNQLLDSISQYDYREDQLEYLYRIPVIQQHQINLSGRSEQQKYYLSAGYDKNLMNDISSSNDRFTFNANHTYAFLENKLELQTGLSFTKSKSGFNHQSKNARYPYENIADENGNHLAITDGNLSLNYAQNAGNGKLLDWMYRPLDELDQTVVTHLTDYRFNSTATYKIIPELDFSLSYLYQKGSNQQNTNHDQYSYYARNTINTLTQINTTSGEVIRPIPLGNIQYTTASEYKSNYGRALISYQDTFGEDHSLNGILGFEVRDYQSLSNSNILYGYDPETGINLNQQVDFSKTFPYFYNSTTARIINGATTRGTTDRNRSYFFNLSYTYKERYILSASARKDESNLFGVKANQKGVPLWSAGGLWKISNEPFYKLDILPKLYIRTTIGYNGNADKSTSAYLTAAVRGNSWFGGPFSAIENPPNPALRWEKVRNINLALDFATKENRISGSIEYYIKTGLDLIGNSPIAPQTGISEFRGNSANVRTNGIDFNLNTTNIRGRLTWNTMILLSFVKDQVTAYHKDPGNNYNVLATLYDNPIVGYPYQAIFSYPYAGLDQQGNPQGYLNGIISKDYTAIRNSENRNNLIYHGSGTPTFFGSLLNTFSYGPLSLSGNITFKSGYYFRRASLDNGTLYNGAFNMPDYGKRWQQAGDESFTSVPRLVYPAVANRTSLYTYSKVLVENGSHVRLRDIRLDYELKKNIPSLPFKNFRLFFIADNLGIIWRENKHHIDPDSRNIATSKTFALGLKADL
ncbi:SusC/RagA family TonB-linked outer membrane protein [Pedobacter sp. ASV1-7]|uniref:SusC/RagA family TonB-linked outer membrane protein n=1 Tax=Pedobacter sp. ASV1-7 TaxID=3145237 RepID=UPI0032E8E08F